MHGVAFQERTLTSVLRRAAKSFPAIVVTGPRQSGKTTLVKHLFGKTHDYCSLDDPTVREQALHDPGLLITRFPPPVIFDEIQHVPQLLSFIKSNIDEHRSQAARFILTGSQLFPLMHGVTESLAGRAAVTTLLSLSMRELVGDCDMATTWQQALSNKQLPSPLRDIRARLDLIRRGGYPEPALNSAVDVRLWYSSYVQMYLERDVRTLRGVSDLGDFQRFIFALAARSGGLINFEDIARGLGVTGKTIRAWVSVLETSGQILTVRPYYANLGKRLVKRPKIYFLDSGILCFLLEVLSSDQLLSGMLAGPVFEAVALGQIHRMLVHRGEPSRIHFWRTTAGHEVDFVIEEGSRLIPIEVKLTSNPTARDGAAIEEFQKLHGKRAANGMVVCLCESRFPLTRTVDAVPLGVF